MWRDGDSALDLVPGTSIPGHCAQQAKLRRLGQVVASEEVVVVPLQCSDVQAVEFVTYHNQIGRKAHLSGAARLWCWMWMP